MKRFIPLLLLVLMANGQSGLRSPALVASLPKVVAAASGCDSVNDASLIAYWKLEEASGSRVDDKGANDLTDNNTVTSGAAKIGDGAQFAILNLESLGLTDNADLSTGDIDFWLHCWVFFDGVTGFQVVMGKAGGNTDEHLLYGNGTTLSFTVAGDNTVNWSGTLSASTWYCIDAWYVASGNVCHIAVNAGTDENGASGNAPADSTSIFSIGSYGTSVFFLGGRVDEAFFSKRVPTSGERTALYNSGNACRPSGL